MSNVLSVPNVTFGGGSHYFSSALSGNSSSSISKIAPALLAAQRKMGNAAKDAKNPFFKSAYADLNSVREACIPVLNEQEISVLQPITEISGDVYVRTILLHSSGEFLASDAKVVVAKANDPQALGAAISYQRRYGLQSFLNIGAEDSDAEGAMAREKPAAPASPKTPAATFSKKVTPPVDAAKQAAVNQDGDNWL